MRHLKTLMVISLLLLAAASCRGEVQTPLGPTTTQPIPPINTTPPNPEPPPTPPQPPLPPPPPPPPPVPGPIEAVLLLAGDIGECGNALDQTGNLIRSLVETAGVRVYVLLVGDIVYPNASKDNYDRCFARSGWWSPRVQAVTFPAPGNHDLEEGSVSGAYYDFFGSTLGLQMAAAQGLPRRGYYSFQAGSWHIASLNSMGTDISWLERDLKSNRSPCTLAYYHHPVFNSGRNGMDSRMMGAWLSLAGAGADVVVSAHEHFYERFAPQDPDGRSNPASGITQFTVGTGGASLYPFVRMAPNSEKRQALHGVLKLSLRTNAYDWDFIPVGGGVVDQGTAMCH